MELTKVIESYANAVDGKFSSYDDTKGVVIVPVTKHRFQSVIATNKMLDGVEYIELSSKICAVEDMPEKLFVLQRDLTLSKLVIKDDFLQVVAYVDDQINPKLLAVVINEVAQFADHKEKEISGKDHY